MLLALLLVPCIAPAAGSQEELPRWEAGLAIGALSLPQYMGSDERYALVVPLPFIIYRGDRVKVDRSGIRAELFGLNRLSLDASFGGGLPVRNSNRARAGMPELKFSFQAGPRLNIRLHEDSEHSLVSLLRLPLRWGIDTAGTSLGWLSEPELEIRWHPDHATDLRLGMGALYASARFNRTYYSVEPQYATPTRPAYRASGGLHSLFIKALATYRWSDDIRLFASIRYRNLSPGVVADSPLVRDRNYLTGVIGMAWSFWTSKEMVAAD